MFVFDEGPAPTQGSSTARDAALRVERRNFLRRLLACPTPLPLRAVVAHDTLAPSSALLSAALLPPSHQDEAAAVSAEEAQRQQARLEELRVACMGDVALESRMNALR